MSTGYQINDQEGLYYLTFQVVDWVDIFTRQVYRDLVVESFKYCIENKGLDLFAFVIMSNHIHLIAQSTNGKLSEIVRDFKKFTSKRIIEIILEIPESRKIWMLDRFSKSNEWAESPFSTFAVGLRRLNSIILRPMSPWFSNWCVAAR